MASSEVHKRGRGRDVVERLAPHKMTGRVAVRPPGPGSPSSQSQDTGKHPKRDVISWHLSHPRAMSDTTRNQAHNGSAKSYNCKHRGIDRRE